MTDFDSLRKEIIEFTNRKSGDLVARIEDCECTLDNSLNEAFRRHVLG